METTLAQRIAGRRKEIGLSRQDLADAAGVTVAAVQAWESGETKNLKHEHLFAVSAALNVNPEWLALGTGPKVAAVNMMEAYSKALARRDGEKSPERRKGWERIAALFARATVVLLVLVLWVPPQAEATLHNVFYSLHNGQQWLRRLLANIVRKRTFKFRISEGI